MKGDTQNGFRLKGWQVYPLRNLLVGPAGEIHIEPKVMQVLESLASNPGEVVERETLLNDLWDGRAFSDEPLTRCIAALRHALEDDPHDPEYIQTIPKRGYRLVCPVESLEQATDDADVKVDEPSVTRIGNVLTGRRRIALPAFLGLILFAAAYVAYRSMLSSPVESPQLTVEGATQSEPPVHSIAVLAFADLSPAGDQEYFSDGISEELLNVLSKLPGLRVVARTSSFQFKGKKRDIIDIGKQLNVAFVLEGSVRKAGPQVRITTQLIDASNGFQLWSETYDRELEHIFAVQDEISTAIVMALKERLGLEVEAIPRVIAAASTEAHDAYLRGRFLVVQYTPTTIEGAIREYEKAISLDPDYALAHAELSIAIGILPVYTGQNLTEAIARAAPHAERAMDLDPSLAEAHHATGYLLEKQGNIEDALTHARHAIQINPNYSHAHLSMGASLWDLGRYAEYYVAVETAVRLDPLSIPARSWHIHGLIDRNRLDEAEREMEKLASTAPVYFALFRGRLDSLGGKWTNAILANLDAWRINPRPVFSRRQLSRYFALIGLETEALAVPDVSLLVALRFLGRHADYAEALLANKPMSINDRSELGMALAAAGDYARARPILEEMWQRSGGRVAGGGVFGPYKAVALIAIRRDAGEEAGVGELLAAMRDNVRRLREARITYGGFADYQEGLVTYLAGERAGGLALMAKGEEEGDFNPPKMAYLQTLYDDPGFAPILARREARQARERRRFLASVCTDNPYEAVWQPAEGTCEQFAAAGGN